MKFKTLSLILASSFLLSFNSYAIWNGNCVPDYDIFGNNECEENNNNLSIEPPREVFDIQFSPDDYKINLNIDSQLITIEVPGYYKINSRKFENAMQAIEDKSPWFGLSPTFMSYSKNTKNEVFLVPKKDYFALKNGLFAVEDSMSMINIEVIKGINIGLFNKIKNEVKSNLFRVVDIDKLNKINRLIKMAGNPMIIKNIKGSGLLFEEENAISYIDSLEYGGQYNDKSYTTMSLLLYGDTLVAIGVSPSTTESANSYINFVKSKTKELFEIFNKSVAENKPNNKPKTGGMGTGTGFVVTKDGVIATAEHVVDGCNKIEVDNLEASVVIADDKNDIALIKVNKTYQDISSIKVRSPKLGDDVMVFGYPLSGLLSSEHVSLTKGSVSSLSGMRDDTTRFRYTAASQPGNSGGPIVDDKGMVVGIVSAGLKNDKSIDVNWQNINFGVRSSLLVNLMDSKNVPITTQERSKEKSKEHYVKVTKYIKCFK